MTVRTRVLLQAAVFLGLALLAAGCASAPQSTLVPRSDQTDAIQGVYNLILVLAGIVFVAVEGLLIYSIVRFRRRPGHETAAQIHGNNRLEVAWTIAPALVLVVIAVPTMRVLFATQSTPPADALPITVTGHQWWWEVQYPNEGITTANEIHLPVGRPVAVTLHSADVIHSFWVPRLAGKMDVVPARQNLLWFTPAETGTYLGQCAEFCGAQHAHMAFRVMAVSQADYDAWVAQRKAPPAAPTGAAAQGQQVFATAGCVACHTIDGTPAQGKIGPNLSGLGTRSTIGAATLANTPENLTRWIHNPQEVKPGNKMPALNLNPDQLAAVVAYLESLK